MPEAQERLDTIVVLATILRHAFEVADRSKLMIGLQSFPGGACGDASLILAHLLSEHGCGEFDYMNGRRDDRWHAWLQRGPLIVDITADQFNDGMPPVFVSMSSDWHAKFNGEREHAANLSVYGPDWERTLLGQFGYLSRLFPA